MSDSRKSSLTKRVSILMTESGHQTPKSSTSANLSPNESNPDKQPENPDTNDKNNQSMTYVRSTGWTIEGDRDTETGGERRRSRALLLADPEHLGNRPDIIRCPRCGHIGLTRVKRKITLKTHLCAAMLFLFGCCPCAIIPYIFNIFKDLYHFCQRCVLIVTIGPVLGREPTPLRCPKCGHEGLSEVKRRITIRTHLCVALLFFLMCIPCCLIPYCAPACQDVNHHCSSCGTYLGTSME